jgi:hypothetical protein
LVPSHPQTASSGRAAQLPFPGFVTHVPPPPSHEPEGTAQISPLAHVPLEHAAPPSDAVSLASSGAASAAVSASEPSSAVPVSVAPSLATSRLESTPDESASVDVSLPETAASLASWSSSEEAQPIAMAVRMKTKTG